MSSLALPKPDNLRVPHGDRAHLVEHDVYHICERVKELDPNLYVYVLDPPVVVAGLVYNYTVTEYCGDGVERLVKRFTELDGRVIEELEYMLRVPFEERLAIAERIETERERERQDAELNELYERVGRPMWTDLERCGFSQRPVSYPKRGVKPR